MPLAGTRSINGDHDPCGFVRRGTIGQFFGTLIDELDDTLETIAAAADRAQDH